jgi:hypothetical protein
MVSPEHRNYSDVSVPDGLQADIFVAIYGSFAFFLVSPEANVGKMSGAVAVRGEDQRQRAILLVRPHHIEWNPESWLALYRPQLANALLQPIALFHPGLELALATLVYLGYTQGLDKAVTKTFLPGI